MHSSATSPWFFPAFIIGFPLFWCAVCYLISFISGWHMLAAEWRANDTFHGKKMRFCSAHMRWRIHYGNCLTLGSDRFGLSMAVQFPFGPGHPALFIPWEAMSVSPERRGIVLKRVGFEFVQGTGVTLWLHERTAQELLSQQDRLRLPDGQ